MATSSFSLGSDDFKQIMDSFNKAAEDGMKMAAHMLWSALLSFLAAHLLFVVLAFVALFALAMLKAMLGRWGSLGSLIYNTLYFGTLLIIGLIFGPDIFISDYFHMACTILLYPICYFATGLILDGLGVRK